MNIAAPAPINTKPAIIDAMTYHFDYNYYVENFVPMQPGRELNRI